MKILYDPRVGGRQGPPGRDGRDGLDGLDGRDGKDATFRNGWRGPWHPDVDYKRGDLVGHQGSTWICTRDQAGDGSYYNAPANINAPWDMFSMRGIGGFSGETGPRGERGPQGGGGPAGLYVQATAPTDAQPNDVWIDTSATSPRIYVKE